MTSFTPLNLSLKNRKLDYVNSIVTVHNLVCGCEQPLIHTIDAILEQEPSLKDIYKKCHPTTTEDGTPTGEDVLGNGDLDLLFAEDFGDNAEGAATTSTG